MVSSQSNENHGRLTVQQGAPGVAGMKTSVARFGLTEKDTEILALSIRGPILLPDTKSNGWGQRED